MDLKFSNAEPSAEERDAVDRLLGPGGGGWHGGERDEQDQHQNRAGPDRVGGAAGDGVGLVIDVEHAGQQVVRRIRAEVIGQRHQPKNPVAAIASTVNQPKPVRGAGRMAST